MHLNLDENFMLRAIDLARLGLGKVSPNPMVGCVVVHDDKIIGEGWHEAFGAPHAEVNAIHAVKDASILPECSVFVNLEPCSFYGKTPPCTDLLLRTKVKRVVVSTVDNNPKVSGKGIKILEEAGIEVTQGVLHDEGMELNKRFFTNQSKKRPYIILKWAQTSDGFLAREDYSSQWISTAESRKLVHKWRGEEDSILVGRKTAIHDNPRLNVRDWEASDPIRVILDPHDSLPENLNIKDGTVKTFIYNLNKEEEGNQLSYVRIDNHETFMQDIMLDLLGRGVGSVLVEGGGYTLQSFIDRELWDEARVFTSTSTEFHKGINAPKFNIQAKSKTKIGDDILKVYKNEHG